MSNDVGRCKDCGIPIRLGSEKALSGDWEMVWLDRQGTWVCPVTGDEHAPGEPSRPVKVIVRHGDTEVAMDLSLAEAGNFVFGPIDRAVDDSEPSWDMQDQDPERFAEVAQWSRSLYGVTG